jgi:hypothetical protein
LRICQGRIEASRDSAARLKKMHESNEKVMCKVLFRDNLEKLLGSLAEQIMIIRDGIVHIQLNRVGGEN